MQLSLSKLSLFGKIPQGRLTLEGEQLVLPTPRALVGPNTVEETGKEEGWAKPQKDHG